MNSDGKPKGGRWSFDEENRKKLPNKILIPTHPKFNETLHTKSLKKYIEIATKDEGLDAVFGSRFKKESKVYNYPLKKLLLNRLFNYFVKI